MQHVPPLIFRFIFTASMFVLVKAAHSQDHLQQHDRQLIFEADFSSDLDTNDWKVELDSQSHAAVYTEQNDLIVNSYGGATVWFNRILTGNIEVTYNRRFVLDEGPNDRLSDLNQFWMALDPKQEDLFTRKGKFEEYDDLMLYYMGMGGNYNETTRFRKYDGKGNRVLLKEYLDEGHLLKPDHLYEVRTIVKDGNTKVWIDGVLFFDFTDSEPLTAGYFGFRSTYSHQKISNFKVYQLP